VVNILFVTEEDDSRPQTEFKRAPKQGKTAPERRIALANFTNIIIIMCQVNTQPTTTHQRIKFPLSRLISSLCC
jgi:hypothetical protein